MATRGPSRSEQFNYPQLQLPFLFPTELRARAPIFTGLKGGGEGGRGAKCDLNCLVPQNGGMISKIAMNKMKTRPTRVEGWYAARARQVMKLRSAGIQRNVSFTAHRTRASFYGARIYREAVDHEKNFHSHLARREFSIMSSFRTTRVASRNKSLAPVNLSECRFSYFSISNSGLHLVPR